MRLKCDITHFIYTLSSQNNILARIEFLNFMEKTLDLQK